MCNSTGSFIIGLLSGAAIGAAIGLLYAPEKGSATREKLGQRAHDIKEDLDERFEDLKDYVNDAVGEMKEKVSEVKEKVADIKEKAQKPKAKEAGA